MATERKLELKIEADGRAAHQTLGDIAASIERVGKSAKGETKVGLDLVAQALRELEAGGTQAGDALAGVATSSKQLDAGAAIARSLADEFERAAQSAEGDLKPAYEAVAAELRTVAQGGDQARDRIDAMTESSRTLESVMRRVGAIIVGAFSARELIRAAAAMEELRGGFETLTGSAQGAAREMDFVREVAGRTGQDVLRTAASWRDLMGQFGDAPGRIEPARAAFAATADAMNALGKGQAEADRAMGAIESIARKGVVSLRDLRDGLGKELPGALDVAAGALGVTREQLEALAKDGQLTADDLLPALTQGLKDLYGGAPQAQSLAGEITNIKNALADMGDHLGEAGGLDALKWAAEAAQTAIVLLDDALVTAGKTIGTLVGAIATLDFSGVTDAFADIEAESRDKLLRAAKHNETLANYIQATGNEALRAALAQQQAAQASEKAGAAAAAAGDDYVKLSAGYQTANEWATKQVALAAEEVKATQARGAAAVEHARALGDVNALRQAEGVAAAANADALQAVADKRREELATLQAQAKALRDEASAQGEISAQRQRYLTELDDLIAKKAVEVDASAAQADAARAVAAAKGEEAQAATAAREAAQVALVTKRAEAEAGLTLLGAQKELARQSEQIALLMGDEEAARRYRIQQLEIDIKMTRAKADVQRAEAQGAIAVAQATLEELRAKRELTPVKEAELNASIRLAQAKIKEADAIRQSANVTQTAINNLRDFGREAVNAGNAGHAAGRRAAEGWREAADATGEAAKAAKEYQAFMDSRFQSGWAKNADGSVVSAREDPALRNARLAARFGEDMIGNQNAEAAYNLGNRIALLERYSFGPGDGSLALLKQELERLTRAMEADRAARTDAPSGGARRGGVPSSVIRVELGADRYDVDTTTAAGVNQLNGLLKALGSAQRRAA